MKQRVRRVAVMAMATLGGLLGGLFPLVAQEHNLPEKTALDDYIAKPDSTYSWKIVSESEKDGMKTVVIDMTSQTWRRADEVNRTRWQHWLILTFPAGTKSETGFLFISGGSNGGQPPTRADDRVSAIARATRTVVAELKMVPNQPLIFHGDGIGRVEDDLVAYTWDMFLKTGDPTWPARNPMVKSAVRAMDTITAATRSLEGVGEVKRFVVAGGSKRGWTTWLTGAVDNRVVAIIPIVIDVVNVNANTHHHFSVYGFWAPAVGDYVEHGITTRLSHPRMRELLQLVDPWFYRHRLTMPKLILNAAGDQFFPPDSCQYYFDGLKGPKYLRYVPNTDHSLKRSDAVETLIAWYSLVLSGRKIPEFTWEHRNDGALVVKSRQRPAKVLLWQASNPDARDFRLETLGPQYRSMELTAEPDGSYVARLTAPEKGWTASFVELTYDVGLPVPLKLTTSVHITPDTKPYEGKDMTRPATITIRCLAPSTEVAKKLQQAAAEGRLDSAAKDVYVAHRTLDANDGKIELHVNWTPVGRLEPSAKAMAGWLQQQGCQRIWFQLESGPNHRPWE